MYPSTSPATKKKYNHTSAQSSKLTLILVKGENEELAKMVNHPCQ
jgi:hypothetical protein